MEQGSAQKISDTQENAARSFNRLERCRERPVDVSNSSSSYQVRIRIYTALTCVDVHPYQDPSSTSDFPFADRLLLSADVAPSSRMLMV
jgi:hypothetical protein